MKIAAEPVNNTVEQLRARYAQGAGGDNSGSQAARPKGGRRLRRPDREEGQSNIAGTPNQEAAFARDGTSRTFQDNGPPRKLLIPKIDKPQLRGPKHGNQPSKRERSHDTGMGNQSPLELKDDRRRDLSPQPRFGLREDDDPFEQYSQDDQEGMADENSNWDAVSGVIFEGNGATTRRREQLYTEAALGQVDAFQHGVPAIRAPNHNGRSSASSQAITSFTKATFPVGGHPQTPMMQKSCQQFSRMSYGNGHQHYPGGNFQSYNQTVMHHQQRLPAQYEPPFQQSEKLVLAPDGTGALTQEQADRIARAFGQRTEQRLGLVGGPNQQCMRVATGADPMKSTPMPADGGRTRSQAKLMAVGDNQQVIGAKRSQPMDSDQSDRMFSGVSQAGGNTTAATTQANTLTQYGADFDRSSSQRGDIDCESFLPGDASRMRHDESSCSGSGPREMPGKLQRKREQKLMKNQKKNTITVLRQIQNVHIDTPLAPADRDEDDMMSVDSGPLPWRALPLINKRTRERSDFKMYKEDDLKFLRAPTPAGDTLMSFNMKKLELEYDYDTDEEQLCAAQAMLMRENLDAVQFYIKEGDPLILVENLVQQKRPIKNA